VSATPQTAWKVLTAGEFARFEADGAFDGAPVDLSDGYIHMSTREQLDETLAKHFAGQSDLWLVCVDLTVFDDGVLKWEPSRGSALFPHLYAPLPLSAALAYGPLERDESGELRLPIAG
jgi:uncharacterized protein (DUF952 family)